MSEAEKKIRALELTIEYLKEQDLFYPLEEVKKMAKEFYNLISEDQVEI